METVTNASILRSGELPGWLIEWGPLGNRRRGVAMKRSGRDKLVVFDRNKSKMVKIDSSKSRIMKVAPAAEEFSRITVEKTLHKLRSSKDNDGSTQDLMATIMRNLGERNIDPHLALAKASGALPPEVASAIKGEAADCADSDRCDSDFEIDSVDSAMRTAVEEESTEDDEDDSSDSSDSSGDGDGISEEASDDESDESSEDDDVSEEESDEESDDESRRTVELKVTIQPDGLVRGFSLKKKGAVNKVLKLLSANYGTVPKLFYKDPDGDDVLVHGQSDFDYVVKCHHRSTITKKNKLRLSAIFSDCSTSGKLEPSKPLAEITAVFVESAVAAKSSARSPSSLIGRSSSMPRITADHETIQLGSSRAKTLTGVKFNVVDNVRIVELSAAAVPDRSPKTAGQPQTDDSMLQTQPRDKFGTITHPLTGVRKQMSGEVFDDSLDDDEEAAPLTSINTNNKEFLWQRGEVIGAGSFGQVFSGIDLQTGRRIAIKEVVFGRTQRQREQALSLQLELTILSKLQHPNVIEYLGAEYTKDTLRIFLELAAEGSVKDALNMFGAFPEPLLRIYTADVVRGLLFLHSKGYIHRDIKPSNLLIDKGRVKLADFGCSTTFLLNEDGNTSINDHGTVVGTTIYMSPQVMRGGVAEDDSEAPQGYGRKADVWSLGVTLVEMATGKPPYRNAAAAIYAVCVTKEYPKLAEGMSLAAYRFLDRCLVEEAKYRADCKELSEEPFCTERIPDDVRPVTGGVAISDTDRKMSSTLFFSPDGNFNLSADNIAVDSESPGLFDDSRGVFNHSMMKQAFGVGSHAQTRNNRSAIDTLQQRVISNETRTSTRWEELSACGDKQMYHDVVHTTSSGSGQYSALVGIIDMGFTTLSMDISPDAPRKKSTSVSTGLLQAEDNQNEYFMRGGDCDADADADATIIKGSRQQLPFRDSVSRSGLDAWRGLSSANNDSLIVVAADEPRSKNAPTRPDQNDIEVSDEEACTYSAALFAMKKK